MVTLESAPAGVLDIATKCVGVKNLLIQLKIVHSSCDARLEECADLESEQAWDIGPAFHASWNGGPKGYPRRRFRISLSTGVNCEGGVVLHSRSRAGQESIGSIKSFGKEKHCISCKMTTARMMPKQTKVAVDIRHSV